MSSIFNYSKQLVASSYCALVEREHQLSAVVGQSRIAKIATSILGRKAVASIVENIAEYYGYYAGAIIAAPVGKKIGGALVGSIAQYSSYPVVAYGALKAAHFTHSKSQSLSPLFRTIATIASLLMVTYLGIAGSELYEQKGVTAGEVLGELLAFYGVGILSAFVAIKLCKSEEVLVDQTSIVRTYPFKTIQSMMFCALLEYAGLLPSNALINAIVNLALGSIAFNALDIKDLYKSGKKGELFNGMPERIRGFETLPQLVSSCSQTVLSRALSFTSRADSALLQGSFNVAMIKPLQKIFLDAFFNLFDLHKSISTITGMPELHLINEISNQKAFCLIVRSFNLYFDLMSAHPDFFEKFALAVESIEEYPAAKSAADFLVKLVENPVLKEVIISHLVDSVSGSVIDVKSRIEEILYRFPTISAQQIKNIAESLVSLVRNMESRVVGFEFSSSKESFSQVKTLQKHLEWTARLFPVLFVSSLEKQCDHEEIRRFYMNLNSLICEYYSSTFGETGCALTKKFMDHQILNSSFNPTS